MIQRFAKAFHLISVLLFIVIFMYIYAALPELVTVEMDAGGNALKQIGRDTFFYIGIGAFVVLNVLLVFPAKMIENNSTLNIRRLFPKGDPFRSNMLAWIYSFVGIINISIVILAVYIHGLNGVNEEMVVPSGFGLYLLPVLFVVWIVALFVLLAKKVKAMKAA